MQSVAIKMKEKFNKYFGDFDKEVRTCLNELYDAYKEDAIDVVNVSNGNDASQVEEVNRKRVGDSSMVEKLARKRKPNNVSVISNEVERYLEDVCEKIDGEDFELLSWWRGQKTRYPTLFRIAKDLFAIPCSTVASENAFSLGGRILDPFRASLSPKTVDWLVCSTDWMRGQEFNMYQEPTQEEQEWFKEFEDVEKGLKAFNRLGTTQDLDSDDDMDVEKNRLPSLSSC